MTPSLQVVLGNSKKMLQQALSNKNEDPFNPHDFWLIQVPNVSDTKTIRELFAVVPLQYNSLTFIWSSNTTNPGV